MYSLTRRDFLQIVAGGIAAAMGNARGQQRERVPVVGLLMLTAARDDPLLERLRRELRLLGYVEGESIRFEHRNARGQADLLPVLAKELVAHHVDVIVVGAEAIARVAMRATSTIPIIMIAWDYDPVASGLVQSLRRPGGNITGLFPQAQHLVPKCLELSKELLPGISRIAVMYDDFGKRQLQELDPAARELQLQVQLLEVRQPQEYGAVFQEAMRKRADAVLVLGSPRFYVERDKFARLALESRLPTIHLSDATVRAGGLISYGADLGATFGRAAYYVDRVLKGVKPGELPIEQPGAYKLVVNLKTAKALGLTVPQSILVRADEVIQ